MKSFLQRIPGMLRRLLFVRASLRIYSLFLIRILGTAFSLLYTLLLGRTYGAEGTGLFYIYRNWFNILGNQLTGNYQVYVTRKAIFLQAQGRSAASVALVNAVAAIVAFISLLLIGLVAILPASSLNSALDPHSIQVLLILAAVGGALFLVIQNLAAGLRAFHNAPASLLLQFVIPPAIATLALGLPIAFALRPDPFRPAASFTLSYLCTAIIAGLVWRHVVRNIERADRYASADSTQAIPERPQFSDFINRGAMVLLVAGWISVALENLPFYFLSALGSLREIAFYGVADRLVSISSTVLYSLGSDYLARFSRLYAQHDLTALQNEFIKSQIYCFVLFSPFLAAFLLLPRWILSLFGRGFIEGTPYLFILLVGDVVNAATGLVGTLLYAMEDEVFMLRSQALSLILLCAGLLIGWSYLGGIGVALAASIMLGVRNLVYFVRVLQRFRQSAPAG